MNFARFFVDRPIFAGVVSIFITLIGGIAYFALPVAQYPEIAPPTVVVSAQYPGASAEVISNTVATPLEQEINGVDDMLYMLSQSTSDGKLTITVTFALGTDPDEAQVLVQNRVSAAEPRLPEEVRRLGVTTRKNSPDFLMVAHLFSPDQSRDQLYISNYATLQLVDVLKRINGVGDVQVFGAREYAMRIWLDPDKIAARGLTGSEVVAAVRSQNLQVASGVLNQPPTPDPGAFQMNLETLGRLVEPRQFSNIVVRTGEDGEVTRLRDVGEVELGAQDYGLNAYLGEKEAVAIGIFQRPGSNALETADAILETLKSMEGQFPPGIAYDVVYNPTDFIAKSIDEVIVTIFEAVALVVLVVVLFLQTWRASIIPIVAIPVSLIGSFIVMAALGYSLNTLTLFGLVLAIGIVVDDAIVVVENVERNLRLGLSPKEAARRTVDEVGGALVAIALVLTAVFIPAAFISGISGQFFRQFAITIATSTIISLIVSLTLSPALSGILFKPHRQHETEHHARFNPIAVFFRWFNRGFEALASGYARLAQRLIGISAIMLLIYAGLVGLTAWQFNRAPTGFIPPQDEGYLITIIQLPPGSSLARTDEVVMQATKLMLETPGVINTAAFAGLDGATFTNASNAAAIFSVLAPYDDRIPQGLTANRILGDMSQRLGVIRGAFVITVPPPPVRGIGNAGGFKMMVQDRGGQGLKALEEAATQIMIAGNQTAGLADVFTLFNTRTPKLFAEIDRVRAQMFHVPAERVFQTLEVYLGSTFVNDFNFLNRTFRVTAQALGRFREDAASITNFKTRNELGEMVPIGAVAKIKDISGAYRVARYNLFPAAEVQGNVAPGTSSGTALAAMEGLADQLLTAGFAFEWTELAYQQKLAGDTGLLVFGAAVLFVFLVLAAQYESWALPLSVILIVPMCLLAAVTGLLLRGLDVNVLSQVGFVVLVGLAAKNAILIVEFAKQAEEEGKDPVEAAVKAAGTRLRPILMTSFAFILGVVPLVIASGAGAEMRIAMGTAVFAGMIGVTFFGLLFTPVFYVVVRRLAIWLGGRHGTASIAGPHSAE
ncbi:MAG: multidrug efflux RND transporter permease subunit [Rhodospirillaceae bacterium]|nr:multidrug efflux RND transporter permease subunit [Rhodospirillaceae bacterium]